MTVGGLIRERRERRGWSQEVLSDKLGMKQSYLSRLERDKVGIPQRATLERIGTLLGISLPEFYRAAGVLEGIEEGNSNGAPAPPTGNGDEQPPLGDILDWLRSLPGDAYRAELAAVERELSPAEWAEFVRDVHRAWMSNLHLGANQARRARR